MKRRGTPTLYELARSTSAAGDSPASPTLALAMRSLRVPLGFLWLLGVAVLLVAILAYAFGYGRGKSAGFAEGLTQSLGERTAQATAQRVRDPLTQQGGEATAPAPRVEAASSAKQVPAKTASKASPPGGDPRVSGYWYYTVARPSAAAAQDLLAFCRAEGLDAHLVSDDNGKSRKIIVLPPLMNAEARKTPEGQKLEASIQKAGNRWKAKAKGNKNFSDAYPELFKGS